MDGGCCSEGTRVLIAVVIIALIAVIIYWLVKPAKKGCDVHKGPKGTCTVNFTGPTVPGGRLSETLPDPMTKCACDTAGAIAQNLLKQQYGNNLKGDRMWISWKRG